MTSDTSVPIARVHDLPDLLGVIPHLLGFHPEESMVLVVIDDGCVQLTARADLGDVGSPGHLELLIDRMLVRWPSGGMWLVAYTVAEAEGWRLLERARDHLGQTLVGDPICVVGPYYRAGDSAGPVFPHDPKASITAVAATVHGLQARPSRAMLAELVRPDPREARVVEDVWVRALERVLAIDPARRPDELMRALRRALADPAAVRPDDLAWLGLLINDPFARDRAVLSLQRPKAGAWVELWTRVVRACPNGTQDQALAVLALAAWVNGDGGLHAVCLEEMDALGIAPGLKRLLESLNEAVAPPSDWDELRLRFSELLDADEDVA
ncbi:MAG: DUF4192 domain-containing protein [Micropruina sp.]|uniref:DUF4192 domain-containing protein n=1 Tax=Micropruina sp. TaxID=2737536 RepID=UPI0039E2F275